MSFLTVSAIVPPATVLPYAATSAPDGWLLCDGSAVSRTTYASLFATIGTSYGSGDGSTTFNLPDYRWTFLRGRGPNISVTGSGTASSNQATFTAHGFNRTGVKARLSSGTLSGLAASTDYWVIVVDANTLAFATSKANAIAGTRTAISGANSAVIVQWEDPDASSRASNAVGGNSGAAVGSYESDDFKSHKHNVIYWYSSGGSQPTIYNSVGGLQAAETPPNTVATGGNESRPVNVSINYIIKV